jgi:hypothetical protein
MLHESGALYKAPNRSSAEPSVSEGGKLGQEMADKFCLGPNFHVIARDSLTCRKSTTRDPQLYCPSEGRHAEDFYARKNPTALAGFEPANLGTRGQHANQ